MNNEQLLQLLQQIIDRLGSEESGEEKTPGPESESVIPIASPTPGPGRFSIYKNKKLIIEALPGYMFIQPENDPDTANQKTPGKPSGGKRRRNPKLPIAGRAVIGIANPTVKPATASAAKMDRRKDVKCGKHLRRINS